MLGIKHRVKSFVKDEITKRGYYKIPGVGDHLEGVRAFRDRADEIVARHRSQTAETIAALKKKYEQPFIGEFEVYQLVEMLAQCIDPTNMNLFCTSQLVHTLQIMEGMKRDGITDRDMLIAGLVHDLGKLAYLTDELPENIEGRGKHPVGPHFPGMGLDHCTFTWEHGEIVYARLHEHLSPRAAWLVRYHSMSPECYPLIDEGERELFELYYRPFFIHDQNSSFLRIPSVRLGDYRELLKEVFPKPILF